jgi:putative ATP-binding cassette transporter
LWGQLVQNFPLIGIGWLFMHGNADFGLIALGGFAFGKVYEALTLPSREWGPISTLKAELERLGPVVEALEAIGQNHMPEGDWIEYGQAETVMFQDVTVFNSYLQQKPAVQHLTLNVTDNVMFAGEDGQGKRSLAEAITNSAARGQGKILRPVLCEIIGAVAPPYLQRSTLREFLCDRCVDPMPSDQDLLRLLHDVGLPHLNELTQGVDTEQDWKAVLSAPEQLLLCLARIVVSGAKVVVIEGATAAVEPEVEEWFYKVLRLKQLRFISFTNDTRVAKYHDRVIELDEHGTPTEVPAAEYQMPRWKIFLRRLSSGDKPDAG